MKVGFPPILRMWDGARLVEVQRTGTTQHPGIEYKLLEPCLGHMRGELFIGYEGTTSRGKPLVRLVRWVPGVAL